MKIGKAFKDLRERTGLKQHEMAKKIGISAPSLSQIENNATIPRHETIKKFAKVINLTPSMIWLYSFESGRDLRSPQRDLFNELFPGFENFIREVVHEKVPELNKRVKPYRTYVYKPRYEPYIKVDARTKREAYEMMLEQGATPRMKDIELK